MPTMTAPKPAVKTARPTTNLPTPDPSEGPDGWFRVVRWDMARVMRAHKVTIRELAERTGLTQERVRTLRDTAPAKGLTLNDAHGIDEAIKAKAPAPAPEFSEDLRSAVYGPAAQAGEAPAVPPTKADPSRTCGLALRIGGTYYRVSPVRGGKPFGSAGRAFRLRKLDGTDDGPRYTVAETVGGITCDCADATYRRHEDGSLCKHGAALVALGLIG